MVSKPRPSEVELQVPPVKKLLFLSILILNKIFKKLGLGTKAEARPPKLVFTTVPKFTNPPCS